MKQDRLIVVVDDEADIRELVELHLKRAGYATAAFENGSDFLRWMDLGGEPLLCVLDVMLPPPFLLLCLLLLAMKLTE